MPTRIVEVIQFDVDVPKTSKNDLKKAVKAIDGEAKVSAAGNDLTISVGTDRIAFTAGANGWVSSKVVSGEGDSETTLAALDAVVRLVGGTFAARVERDGTASEARFEAPKGGGEAPALWAAKRVLAEVVHVSSVDASAALTAISEHPVVKRADVNAALGAEAERVWTALDKQGLVRGGEIPTRGLYIWRMKQQ
jgi:hypothetical protein